ncbi:Large cysteine-rich periplasmic protein OmcB [Rubripirellula tenax]|uniref:Large cysteine-rich periplasmic protein OmcB n=1 Tax=Rubripirellula tenax TaxID=2528015 RepID=A0A5C6EEG0_9BACT|nr:DUF11 domain-containing protein [Rubripirellula tenax]TWU47218.1 Large cysteine-rich periplasmic protein OmcB [Rubripirellula tenax]
MDRVNRRFLVFSTAIAAPALLMTSLLHGASPNDAPANGARQAVGVEKSSNSGSPNGQVRQVVGKQLERGDSRPGFFQSLTGGGNSTRKTTAKSATPARGLLDSWFSGGGRSSNSSGAAQAKSASKSSADVNWDGIPFHKAQATTATNAAAPIRDPSRSAAPTAPRIVRGNASQNTTQNMAPEPAKTTSARTVSTPSVTRRNIAATTPRGVPTPPAETEIKTSAPSPSLSASSSSRRSDRRDVEPFELDRTAVSNTSPTVARTPKPAFADDVVDLVPRVTRREIPSATAAAKKETPAVAKIELPKTTEPKVEPKPAPQPKPAPAAIVAEPKTAATGIAAAVPSATLSAPAAVSTPAYTTPVDPTTTAVAPAPSLVMPSAAIPGSAVPSMTIPSHPYAASNPTPASTVSHRAGPPAAAFESSPASVPSLGVPATHFGSGNTAIGSGISAPGAASQMTRPYVSMPATDSVPAFETARVTPDPFDDPYGRPSYGASNFEPRNPGPATAAVPGRSARPAQDTTNVPMHAINGYQNKEAVAAPSHRDNFDRSNADSRNQMRSAVGQPPSLMGSGMASSELPGIRVVTRGPSEVTVRQTNEYEIRVENRGSIDAEGLIVRAMIPDWAEVRGQNATRGQVDSQGEGTVERLVWKIDHLPAGASEQMFIRLMAARSGTHDVDVDWTLMPQKSVAQIKVQEPRLDLAIEGPDEVIYGQSQTYKVRVLNPGDGVAPNVVFTLSPNSATPQSQRIGDIPAGKEAQFEVELTAQDLGDLKIHGLATGDLELRAEAAKSIRVAAAQIEAILNGPELKYQNTEAMYNLQVKNSGSATSEKVVATLRMPAGVKYLGGVEGAELRANTLRWEITSLAPGATRDYQFRCNMAATGDHLFAFDCKGTAAGFADVALTTRVESIADLVLTIDDPVAPAPIGSEVTYEIVIRNRGSREARDVTTLAQFSHGIEPKRVDGQSGEIVTGQVLFDAIPRIGAGEEIRMRVVAIADRAGHHRFRAEVRSGDTVLVAEEATHYMSPQSDRVSRSSTDGKQIR